MGVAEIDVRKASGSSVTGTPSPFTALAAVQVERPMSAGYLLALLLITPILLLLPLVYLGIIALAAYGTYHHAVEHLAILEGRFVVGRVVLYVGPIIGGIAVVLFMFKPLFARPVYNESLFTLDRSQEPRFYELVDRIALAVGAPRPSSIEIECIPNASASFRRGLIGLVRRNLVLKVGMPLVSCMNARQFAGIVAHELGHFSQGVGMSLTYLVNSINAWFARVVYERDSWDERLEALGRTGDNLFIWCTVAIGRLCVWLVRGMLWALMMFARAVSCLVLRQMEFDADACEAAIAGSESFAESEVLSAEIHATFTHVASQLDGLRAEGQLPDDLPAYVAAKLKAMPAEVRKAINEERAQERTRFFDTHPVSRTRIERARRLNLPGVFHDTSPASRLFANEPLLSRWATLGFYRDHMEYADAAERLAPAKKLIERMHIEAAGAAAVSRYFKDIIHPLHFTFDNRRLEEAMREKGDPGDRLRQARQRFDADVPRAKKAIEAFVESAGKWCDAVSARAMIAAEMRVDAASIGLVHATREEAARRESECLENMEECSRRLAAFDTAAAARIGTALAALAADGTRDGASAQKLLRHAQRLRAALCAIDDVHRIVLDLTRTIMQINAILTNAALQQDAEALASRLDTIATDGLSDLRQLHSLLSSTEHPFAKGETRPSIAQVVVHVPHKPHDAPPAISTACNRLFDLRMECLGRLALVAEKAERFATSARS